MLFDTFDRTGNAQFPYSREVVFRALCVAVGNLSKMSIENRDDLACRLDIKTGMSAFSWGERVSVSVTAMGADVALVAIQSAAKTVLGSAITHGKNRENVREIISHTSRILSVHGDQWAKEMQPEARSQSSSSTSSSERLIADELTKLAELLDKGLLTREEFNAEKTKLLGSDGDPAVV